MQQAPSSLLSVSVLIGLGLLSACSRNQVEPEIPVADPSVGIPSGTVVVEPVIVEPGPAPIPIPGIPTTPGVNTGLHTVAPQEGLYGIARRYGLDYRQLAAWNNIPPPYTIQPGQQLVLSGSGAMPSPVAPPPVVVAPTPVFTPAPTPAPSAPSGGVQYHMVQPGDTLYRIAKSYGLNYHDVAQQNGIPYPYALNVGQRISIYSGYSAAPAAPAPSAGYGAAPAFHSVQPSETLYSLSRRYGQSVQQLATWNGLYPPYTLRVGQSLRVSP